MFDLNELPENDGPTGKVPRSSHALTPGGSKTMKAKEGDDHGVSLGQVEVEEVVDIGKGDGEVGQNEHAFYPGGKAANSGDLAEENHTRVKVPQKSFLRLDSALSVFQPKARAESSLDEIDADNEAGDRRAIPDSQYESVLDSAVGIPTGPGSNFGLSPRPEKLGQRPEISRRQLPLSNSPRLSGKWSGGSKWPGVLTSKKTGGRPEGDLKLDRRHSPTVSGAFSTKIGKRTRDDLDTMIGLKRRGSPATPLKSSDEPGPSLSMSLDQSKVAAKTPSFSSSHRVSLEREAATTLSLGEPHLKGVEPLTVTSPIRSSPSLTFKSEFGLSMVGASTGKRLGSSVNNRTPISNMEEDEGTDDSVASRRMNWSGRKSFDKSGSFEKPFWQGRFSVEGSWTIDVAAYCSQYLHPTSKLWSLPRIIAVERLVKMEELRETLRRFAIGSEPPMRFQLQPGEVKRAQSFSSLVTALSQQSKEGFVDVSPKMQFGSTSGSDALRKKSMQSAGASDVLQATLRLKQTKHAPLKNPAKLYLVASANCEFCPEIRKYFLRELNRSTSRGDNVLFGFLCAGEEESGRLAKTSRAEYEDIPQGISHLSGLKDDEQGVLSTRLSNRNDGVADSFVSNSSSDKRSQDAFNGENERARRDNQSHRYNLSPVDGEVHQERDGLRERDRDLRSREKDRDFRSLSKSFRRDSDRTKDMSDLSKRSISKDREFDWSKDKSLRELHWDQEKEKQKDRLRYREREEMENSGRKRFRSSESDKETEVESNKSRLKSDDLSTGKDAQDDKLEDERKKRGTNGLEGVSSQLTSTRELNVAQPQVEGHPAKGADEMVKLGAPRHQEKPYSAVHGESSVKVRETVSSKDLHDVEGDVKAIPLHVDPSSPARITRVGPAQKDSAGFTSPKDLKVSGSVENARDSALVSDLGVHLKRTAARRVLGDTHSGAVNEALNDQSFDQEKALEDQSFDVKDRECEGGSGKDFGECTLESLSNDGEKEDSETNVVTGHARGSSMERSISPELQDDDQRTKLKSSSSARAASVVAYAPERQRIRENELNLGNCLEVGYALPTTEKTVISGADDSPGNLAGPESPSTDNGLGAPSLSMSVDSRDFVLEGCDKETRVWLVSDQYKRYLSEEFGVRITKLEEVVSTKSESSMSKDRGPLDVRVILTTEKSTDAIEANWFMDHAADMILALSSRGVFSKYLWYQGQVQRYANDHAPTTRVIVRKIKGQDGKNLENIQDKTGVMIGIVHPKKEIVDPARVIGLRLNGTRKKALEEASTLVQGLLSGVAENFSKVLRPTQDVARLKPKSEFPQSTSPSPTPMLKDAFAPFSPAATVSSLDSFKRKLNESSSDVLYSSTVPGDGTLGTLVELAPQSRSDDEREDSRPMAALDAEAKALRNTVLVRNIPKDASGPMLREVFENALKFGLSTDDEMSDTVVDVKLWSDKSSALVELASDELLLEVIELYTNNRHSFHGLHLELGPIGNVNRSSSLERLFLAPHSESDSKGLDYDGGPVNSPNLFRSRSGRKGPDGDDRQARVSTLHTNVDNDFDMQSQDRRIGSHPPGAVRGWRSGEWALSLYVTELMRNDNEESIVAFFEDIIKEHVPHSVGNPNGWGHVKDVRFMPASGCAFVDLATPELVDAILDLHSQRPEIFRHMKVGRKPVPPSQGGGEELAVVKRPAYFRNASLEMSHSFRGGRKGREYFQSSSPPRGSDLAVMDPMYINNSYEEDEQDERQPLQRKHRSDPERTVYADRLPDSVSEDMITRIFEQVLGDNMTDEQREMFGDDVVEQVRYVPAKYCAFVVFKTQQLTRLVLQLYNQDEEIFKNMRLKPHFHSKMEDLYKVDDGREREEGPSHRSLTRDLSTDRRKRRIGMDDHQSGYLTGHADNMCGSDLGSRGRVSFVHRAVASTAYKEVDRRRSVYVDRIPERLMPEPTMRDTFERALKQNRRGFGPRMVSEVTFFRDKFDHERLCAFVELENEDLVQELLEIHMENEGAFFGMRVRPAVKYGNG